MADLVVVARFQSRSEAIIAKSLLESEGIGVFMPDFNVLTADLDPSYMQSGWRLMVTEPERARAQTILSEAQATGDDD